jgi:Xaa-Pro aminopeptidase
MSSRRLTFLQIATPEIDADIYYATRFAAPDPVILIEHHGQKILAVTDFERDRALKVATVDTVWPALTVAAEDARRRRTTPDLTPSGLAAAALRKLKVSLVEVPASMPIGFVERLHAMGFKLHIRSEDTFPRRLTKGPDEVRAIVAVQRATERAMAAAASMLRASRIVGRELRYAGKRLCAEDLRQAIQSTLLERQCIGAHTIVAVGNQAVDPHEEGHGPIRPGQPVVIDIFPRSMRTLYFADMTRTLVRGQPQRALVAQYRAVLKAQNKALSLIRPGVAVRAVHQAVQQVFADRGFVTGEQNGRLQGFTHSTGHGVGLEIHEPPRIGVAPESVRFRAGMIVTVEPGLYYYGVGGVRIEDLVLVTRQGIRNLTRYPKKLVV